MDFGEKERFGSRESKILSRRSENEMNQIAPHYIQKTASQWIKDLSGIYRALNLDRRESIEDLLRICQRLKDGLDGLRICRESIKQTKSTRILLNGSKKLSRMCQVGTQKSRWIEKLSRCYQEDREHREIPRWIENLLRLYQERRKKSSIERNLLRICRGAIELEENEFFKEEKHKEIKATSKLLSQRSNQHIKLSKLNSTLMQSIHRSKNTLNKSNQFYISKTS